MITDDPREVITMPTNKARPLLYHIGTNLSDPTVVSLGITLLELNISLLLESQRQYGKLTSEGEQSKR